jgi:reductive dehalogenase
MRPPAVFFPVPDYRFDQKNEVFKRNFWDEKMQTQVRLFNDIRYQKKAGYRKIDYAFRNATWSLEHGFGLGCSKSGYGLYAWTGVPDKIKLYVETGDQIRESPEQMSHIIKKAARFFGADLVGICKVHPNWIYSHEFNVLNLEHYPIEVPEDCRNAIVMAFAMDYQTIRSSPSATAGAATGLGYSKMAFVARMMAIFIRGLGFRAIPCGNDTALSVPLAMAAGLGEWSRMGLLVTEKLGPRVRISKVFTDMPLHQDAFRPFGVAEFCKTCKKCASHCPSQAIPRGEMTLEGPNISSHSGVLKWYIDGEKCYSFWAKNRMDCTNCIRVCPFNKPPGISHDAARAIIRKTPLFNNFFVWLDSLFAYDKPYPSQRFWGEDRE